MRVILPPDGGPIAVTQVGVTAPKLGDPAILVLVEIAGGPFITLTSYQWNDLVRRIRAARTERELGA